MVRKHNKSIGNNTNRNRCAQRLLRPLTKLVHDQLGQANEQRMAGFSGLYCSDEGHLVLCARPLLPPGGPPPRQASSISTRLSNWCDYSRTDYDLLQLVFQQPVSLVAHSRVTLESQRQYAALQLTQLVGEGFDYPPLDTLVQSMPISWKGTLQQSYEPFTSRTRIKNGRAHL